MWAGGESGRCGRWDWWRRAVTGATVRRSRAGLGHTEVMCCAGCRGRMEGRSRVHFVCAWLRVHPSPFLRHGSTRGRGCCSCRCTLGTTWLPWGFAGLLLPPDSSMPGRLALAPHAASQPPLLGSLTGGGGCALSRRVGCRRCSTSRRGTWQRPTRWRLTPSTGASSTPTSPSWRLQQVGPPAQ
jgi:hypothetical protein